MTQVKTPLELAALATAAVPGLNVIGLCPPQFSDEVVSVTGVIDSTGTKWTVTCPHDTVGGLDLGLQAEVLARLAKAHDVDRIPFDVPRLQGVVRTKDGARVMVHKDLGGRFLTDADFDDAHVLPASLGRALASLHNLPDAVYTGVDLPAYSAVECRDRHVAMLDEAARETVIPANLWNRWEAALEDIALWRFRPAPVHGDLQMTSVVVNQGRVNALAGFSSAHVGDPATDVAWVLAQAGDAFLERFTEAYSLARAATDLHLLTRAQLVSELAIVRWLVHGVHAEDRVIVADAEHMLAELAADVGEEPLVRPRPDVTEVPTELLEAERARLRARDRADAARGGAGRAGDRAGSTSASAAVDADGGDPSVAAGETGSGQSRSDGVGGLPGGGAALAGSGAAGVHSPDGVAFEDAELVETVFDGVPALAGAAPTAPAGVEHRDADAEGVGAGAGLAGPAVLSGVAESADTGSTGTSAGPDEAPEDDATRPTEVLLLDEITRLTD